MNSNQKPGPRAVAGFALVAFITACGTTQTIAPPLPNDIVGEMHHVIYDVIAVNVETSPENIQTLGVEGAGQATKEGFVRMGQAPIGCLGAGMYAGLCYAMMPFFPIIAASRAEDPEKAREELGEFYARIEDYDLHGELESRLVERMAAENLPLVNPEAIGDSDRLITLNVYTSPMQLQHSGYKKGYIDVTLPYTIELTDSNGQILTRKSGKAEEDFMQSSRSATLYPNLEQWSKTIVDMSVSKVILEWQPEIALGNSYPIKVARRTWLGFKYLEWVPVESLTPRIEWQRLDDIMVAERLSQITDVSYEVEIFGYVRVPHEQHWQRRTVIKATALAEPYYVPATELLPCQRYYWQPKARFFYRGTMRTTTLPDKYELRTSGPDCRNPAYLLPETPVLEGSIVGP